MPQTLDQPTGNADDSLTLTEWQEKRSEALNELTTAKKHRATLVEAARKYHEDASADGGEFDPGNWERRKAEIDLASIELKDKEGAYRVAAKEVDRLLDEENGRERGIFVGNDGQALMEGDISPILEPPKMYVNRRQLPLIRNGGVDSYIEHYPEAYQKNGVNRADWEYREAFNKYASAASMKHVSSEVYNKLTPMGESGENILYAPPQLLSLFLRSCDRFTFVRSLATVITAPHVESTGIRKRDKKTTSFSWGCECVRPKCDTPGFGLRTLQPHAYSMCSCLCRALLRRTTFNLEAFLADELARDAAENQEEAFLNGNGNHQPLGLFVNSTDGLGDDQDVTSINPGGIIASDDLIKLWMALPQCYRSTSPRNPQAQTGGAVWVMHTDWLSQVMMLKTGDGQYIWRPWIAGTYPSELLGRPVYESQFAPNATASGSYAIGLFDMSQYYIVDGPNLGLERDDDPFDDTACWIGRGYSDGGPIQPEAFVRLKLQ